ncbi:hypothetical protein [Kitasatospora phosalacinea]|uniref:Uncharacterized protein n=1 Tax=Kitasatospora phosalacinea TaxID=2065 RepID=A0ABW6GRE5_9ACTN
MTRVLAAAGWLLLAAAVAVVPLVLTLALCRGAAHGDQNGDQP